MAPNTHAPRHKGTSNSFRNTLHSRIKQNIVFDKHKKLIIQFNYSYFQARLRGFMVVVEGHFIPVWCFPLSSFYKYA